MKNRVLYLQAGGPTSVINASFCGLYEEAKKDGYRVFVSPYGLTSLLRGEIREVDGIDTEKLMRRPGSFFGSARIFLSDPEKIERIVDVLLENDIEMLFINGGNDSMDSALKIARASRKRGSDLRVIGIPKTIDNDLKECDHTPGYGSASRYIIEATAAIILDDLSYERGRINVIEVMGRDSGYLALSSALAGEKGLGPDLIYVPEVTFSMDEFIGEALDIYEKRGRCNVVVSEGIKDERGDLISAIGSKDAFGNTQLGGVAHHLADELKQKGAKTRGIELSVLQRSAFFLTSEVDVRESQEVGRQAFLCGRSGESAVMIATQRISDDPYEISYRSVPLEKVATLPRSIDMSFYDVKRHQATPQFLTYLRPLVGDDPLSVSRDL